MENKIDFNTLVPYPYRRRLNMQKNILKLEGVINSSDKTIQPYRYVIGLGETHYKLFDKEIIKLTDKFPWTKKKHIRFIINELILNSQFSMLREVVRKVPIKKKVPAYFYMTVYINNSFLSAGIEEFGDFFDYFDFMKRQLPYMEENGKIREFYDEKEEETVKDITALSLNQLKLVLTSDSMLSVPDESNRIGLNVIESATDNDFYITSFYKNGVYMWKRIHFRIENDL